MTRDCQNCGGTGSVGTGRRIGPEEWERTEVCSVCGGSKTEVVRCEMCGEDEATREAWVVGGLPGLLVDWPRDRERVAVRMRLCLDCHDDPETEIVIVTTRVLPRHEERGHA